MEPARPRLLLASRAFILIAVVAAAVTPFLLGGARRRPPLPATDRAIETFVCPMHPEVVAVEAGDCPICRMALERRGAAGPASAPRGGGTPTRAFSLPPGTAALLEQDVAIARRLSLPAEIVAPAWLDGAGAGRVLLYPGEGTPGTEGRFVPAGGGGAISVRLADEPPDRWDGVVVSVRFRVVPAGPEGAAANGPGWLQLGKQNIDAVAVPPGAIVSAPEGTYVFVPSPDRRRFARRPVEVGRYRAGLATLLSGVGAGEKVVATGAFLLAAEQRLGAARDPQPEATP